jgi:hypothetical protein
MSYTHLEVWIFATVNFCAKNSFVMPRFHFIVYILKIIRTDKMSCFRAGLVSIFRHVSKMWCYRRVTLNTRWFKYDRDDLCVNKSQFVPVIFEPPCIF